jgi:biopolymer transport protein ExbD
MNEKKKSKPNIPTASMGDIAFLIIIFFMVSTVFTRDKGLKMMLPEKTEEQGKIMVKPENIITIAINPVGEVKLKTGGIDEYVLPGGYERIKTVVEQKLLERDTLLVVSLRTSRDTPYKNMIEVLDEVKVSKVIMPDGREVRANKISLVPTSEE